MKKRADIKNQKYQKAIRLKYESFSYPEIAQLLKVSEITVKRWFRPEGLLKFQEMIFPEGVFCDYSTFGTVKTADIYTLKQLIDTPNSTMVPSVGIEPTLTA